MKKTIAIMFALFAGSLAACATEAPRTDDAEQALTCSPDPGVPLPVSDEDAFTAEVNACVATHRATFGTCFASACRDFTGCQYCYIQ